jgi:hypothetical protein
MQTDRLYSIGSEYTLTPLLILPWKKGGNVVLDRSPLGGLPSRSLDDSSHGRMARPAAPPHVAGLSFKRKPCPSTSKPWLGLHARYSSDGAESKKRTKSWCDPVQSILELAIFLETCFCPIGLPCDIAY